MTSFVIYDLIFLVVFTLFVTLFLYTRRSSLKRQGILYLYRTSFGLKIIDIVAKKFKKILKPMQYVIVTCGYVLMISMVWLLLRFVYIYLKSDIARQIKIPPLLPLFPYATDLFKIDFLPPFYFTYWIIVIAIIAVTHEFAHGIFARLNNIKVQSTGFGFLGPFLAAFVEPNEKQMQKAKKFPQLSILAAGTFANVLMTILFGIIMWIFFVYSFTPAGIIFNTYGTNVINISQINEINGVQINNILDASDEIIRNTENNYSLIKVGGAKYLMPPDNLINSLKLNLSQIVVYEDAPAINNGLKVGTPIIKIDNQNVESFEQLGNIIRAHNPGDKVKVVTLGDKREIITEVELGDRGGFAYLGIGVYDLPRSGVLGWFNGLLTSIKSPFIYYEPVWDGDFAWFIYNLLWWIVIINISVALVNMLPVGIFDGGRFFYLTVWGLTGKESWAKKAFSFTTWATILIAILLTVRWAYDFF